MTIVDPGQKWPGLVFWSGEAQLRSPSLANHGKGRIDPAPHLLCLIITILAFKEYRAACGLSHKPFDIDMRLSGHQAAID